MVIVIVMPTYNEAENIGAMIEALMDREFPAIDGAEMHLLVVDDASPDGTGEIVRKETAHRDRLHLMTGEKAGLGHAYIRGMIHAMDRLGADAVIEMDADFQHDPHCVGEMVRAFRNGADYVIGSRYTPGGSVTAAWPWSRRLISALGNGLARRILDLRHVHDLTTGFRLTRVAGILNRIDLENLMAQECFAYKIELLYRTVRFGVKTVEIPIAFAGRHAGRTKFSGRELFASSRVLAVLWLRERFPLRKTTTRHG